MMNVVVHYSNVRCIKGSSTLQLSMWVSFSFVSNILGSDSKDRKDNNISGRKLAGLLESFKQNPLIASPPP